jgi:hypothetical protein
MQILPENVKIYTWILTEFHSGIYTPNPWSITTSLPIIDCWLGLMNVNTFSLNYFHLQDPSTVRKRTELPLHEPASQ